MNKNVNYFLIIAFFSIFASACGRIELKSTTGVKYFFKKENVSCDPSTIKNMYYQQNARAITCTANGYKVDLAGNKSHAHTESKCWLDNPGDFYYEHNYEQFSCSAAIKFGELEKYRRKGTPFN